MTTEEFYTYEAALKTRVYGNNAGGITVEQDGALPVLCDDGSLIILNLHQARWLADRLVRIANEIEADERDADRADGE